MHSQVYDVMIRITVPDRNLLIRSLQCSFCLLVLGVSIHRASASQTVMASGDSPRRSLYTLIYSRAQSLEQAADQDDISGYFHHIWMSYQVDSTQPSVLMDLAQVYMLSNRYPEALSLLQSAFRRSGGDRFIGNSLLDVAAGLQRWDEAIAVSEALLKDAPEDPMLLGKLSEIYSQTKQYDKAIALQERIERAGMKSPQLLMRKGALLVQAGRKDEAVQLIREYLQQNPRNKSAALMAAGFFAANDMQSETVKVVKHLRRQFPSDIESYLVQVTLAARGGQYKAAGDAILEAARIEGVTPDQIAILITESVKASGGSAEYLKALIPVQEKLTKLYPKSDDFATQLAGSYFATGDSIQGDAIMTRLVREGSHTLAPYLYLADIYGRSNSLDSLQEVSEKAIELFPKEPSFYLYSIFYHIQKGDTARAVSLADSALVSVPQEAQSYTQLQVIRADLYNEGGEYQKAFDLYEEVIGKVEDPMAYNNYAYALAIHGKPEDLSKAETLASKAVKIMPGQAAYLDTYAWILYLKGAYDLAKVYQESALSKAEEPNHLYYEHYAEILEKLGDKDGALKAWHKALELSDDKEMIQERIQKLSK